MALINLDSNKKREVDFKRWQSERDEALNSMTHTLADGSVVQVRPKDLPNFQIAIEAGSPETWVLADNTARVLTVEEMQECVDSGVAQGKEVWSDFTDKIK